jgi:hypothetical protein
MDFWVSYISLLIFLLLLGPGLGKAPTGAQDGIEHIFKLEIDKVLIDEDNHLYVKDAFEWDLSNPDNSPDDMAS